MTASALRATHQLVTGLIGRELRREELPAGTLGGLEQQEVLLAKTADRSVLGCMNEMAFRCEHAARRLASSEMPLTRLCAPLTHSCRAAQACRPSSVSSRANASSAAPRRGASGPRRAGTIGGGGVARKAISPSW